MARASNLTMCSFCGKSHSEVRKLIAGPGVYICDSCIVVCKNILDKEINEDSETQISDVSANDTGLKVPDPITICKKLDDYVIGQDHAKRSCQWQYIITISGYFMIEENSIAQEPKH